MSKPTVDTNPVANQYAASNELIIEFSFPFPEGQGGLIAFSTDSAGHPRIDLYRMDAGIQIIVSGGADSPLIAKTGAQQ